MKNQVKFAVAALAVAATAAVGVQISGADFTSGSSHQSKVIAGDWVAPVVSLAAPAATVSGSVTLTASATDTDGSGVTSVRIEYAVAGSGQWQQICERASAPYSCDWNTAALADGSYDLRARATDAVDNTGVSESVSTRVLNQSVAVLETIPSPVRGAISLSGRLLENSLSWVYFQYRVSGSSNWTDVPGCGYGFFISGTKRDCTWTPAVEASYDIRFVADRVFGGTSTDTQYNVRIDNLAPTGTLTVPGAPLSGTVTLTATASDATAQGTGVASVDFQYRRAGGQWISCGVSASAPYRCALDTKTLANGSYDFRIRITDVVGNVFESVSQTRTVDNVRLETAITSPAANSLVSGQVTVTASAASNQPIGSVRIDVSLDGSTWQPVCSRSSAPWSCTVDTNSISTRQDVKVRSVATLANGMFAISEPVSVTVDNTPLLGFDIQGFGAAELGRASAGDRFEFTYAGEVDLGTVKAGWNGASTSITATLDQNSANDQFTFDANLGTLSLGSNYISNGTAVFGATMTATQRTVSGARFTVITVQLGQVRSGAGNLVGGNGNGTLNWAPSALVRTPAGVSGATTTVMESGPADRDL